MDRPPLSSFLGSDPRPPLDSFLSGPDFSDVSGSASSTASAEWEDVSPVIQRRRKPGGGYEYRPKPRLAGAEPGLNDPAPPKTEESWADRYMRENNIPSAERNRQALGDEIQNILSGAKTGTDFLVHLPQTVGHAITGGFLPTGVEAAPGAVEQALPLPQIVEDTLQSTRDERERLKAQTVAHGIAAGEDPAQAALDFAVPQTVGNLLDPTMFLGAGEAKAGFAARGAYETAGQRTLRRAMGDVAEAEIAAPVASGRAVAPDLADLARTSLDLGASPAATGRVASVVDAGGEGAVRRLAALDDAGQPIGGMTYTREPGGGFRVIDVATGERGTGAGRAMYQAAAEREGPYLGSMAQTPEGEGFVARLRETDPQIFGDRSAPLIVRSGGGKINLGGAERYAGVGTDELSALRRNDHLYRGMTEDEFNATVGNGGGIRSSQDFSVPGEGTSFADDPAIAEDYVNFGRTDPRATGRPNYLVEVQHDPARFKLDRDGYYKAPEEVPPAAIRRVWRMRPEGDQIAADLIHSEASPTPRPSPAPDSLTTSLKNAVTREERAARELPQVEIEGRRALGEDWLKAKARIAEDPEAPRRLAQVVAKEPRVLNPEENALLLHDRMQLSLEHRDALNAEAAALKSGDQAALSEARVRRVAAEDALAVNDEAASKAGYEWGIAGRARQDLIREDYSAARLLTRARVAAAGKPIPAEVEGRLIAISRELEAAQAKAAKLEEALAQREAEKKVAAIGKDVARAERSGGRAAATASLDAEYQDLARQFRANLNRPRAGLDPELAGIVGKMAANRVKAGSRNLSELVDGIYQTLRPHVENLEPRDVRDAISGYGVTRSHPARAEAVAELARLKSEARAVSALEDAEGGLVPAGRGRRPAPPPPVVAELRAKVREAMRSHGMDVSGEPLGSAALKAYKTRTARRIAELEDHLAKGYFPKKARRPLQLDPEAINLQGRLNGLKREADTAIRRLELQNRSWWEKGIDWTVGWGRALKLSSTGTISKLTAAAGTRTFLVQPAESLMEGFLTKLPVLRRVAERAPIHGGGLADRTEAILNSWAKFFAKDTREAAWGQIRHLREDPLSLAFDAQTHRGSEAVPAWMNFFGHLHAGLKVPAKYAGHEYAATMERRFFEAMKAEGRQYMLDGKALTDPIVQLDSAGRAYEFARRGIFMQDNAFVKWFRQAMRRTSADPPALRVAKGAVETVLPIVKVPMNYIGERLEYATGIPEGLGRLATAVHRGLDTLAPAEADKILRQITRGSLGAGLAALGYAGAEHFGGYWQGKGDHRRPGELQPGELRVFGATVPHTVLHHPIFEQMQFFATLAQMKAHYTTGERLHAAAMGTAEQIPFVDEAMRLGKTAENTKGLQRFAGDWLRGMTIPPDIQRQARLLDERGEHDAADYLLKSFALRHIDARKRTPQNLWEEEMLGIPKVREGVR